MPKKRKERNSVISFRLNKNINQKTLDIVNQHFRCGKQAKLINHALELYCALLEGGDVLGLLKTFSDIDDKPDTTLSRKNPGDNLTCRLSQDISDNVLDIVNSFYNKNLLTHLVNVSLELYRVLKEVEQSRINIELDNKESNTQESIDQKEPINENTILALNFLRNIQK